MAFFESQKSPWTESTFTQKIFICLPTVCRRYFGCLSEQMKDAHFPEVGRKGDGGRWGDRESFFILTSGMSLLLSNSTLHVAWNYSGQFFLLSSIWLLTLSCLKRFLRLKSVTSFLVCILPHWPHCFCFLCWYTPLSTASTPVLFNSGWYKNHLLPFAALWMHL